MYFSKLLFNLYSKIERFYLRCNTQYIFLDRKNYINTRLLTPVYLFQTCQDTLHSPTINLQWKQNKCDNLEHAIFMIELRTTRYRTEQTLLPYYKPVDKGYIKIIIFPALENIWKGFYFEVSEKLFLLLSSCYILYREIYSLFACKQQIETVF